MCEYVCVCVCVTNVCWVHTFDSHHVSVVVVMLPAIAMRHNGIRYRTNTDNPPDTGNHGHSDTHTFTNNGPIENGRPISSAIWSPTLPLICTLEPHGLQCNGLSPQNNHLPLTNKDMFYAVSKARCWLIVLLVIDFINNNSLTSSRIYLMHSFNVDIRDFNGMKKESRKKSTNKSNIKTINW